MTESLAFKERPSFGHVFIIYLSIYYFIETDYSASLKFLEFK